MERLTERFSNGQAAVYGCGNNCKYDFKYCNNHYKDCPTINEIYEKLATYEDAEEQGLLLRLPCRVGDSVFKIIDECDLPGDCYTKLMCKGCEYRNLYIEEDVISSNREAVSLMDYIGKTVFLTREEAEKTLKQMGE